MGVANQCRRQEFSVGGAKARTHGKHAEREPMRGLLLRLGEGNTKEGRRKLERRGEGEMGRGGRDREKRKKGKGSDEEKMGEKEREGGSPRRTGEAGEDG